MDRQLVHHKDSLGPRAAIFMKGVWGNAVPGFTTRDLVAVQIKCLESKNQRDVMVRSAYFPSDNEEIPPLTDFNHMVEQRVFTPIEIVVSWK